MRTPRVQYRNPYRITTAGATILVAQDTRQKAFGSIDCGVDPDATKVQEEEFPTPLATGLNYQRKRRIGENKIADAIAVV